MTKPIRTALVPVEHITRAILPLRGQRVILDSDLAAIYGVSTGRLNEAVKRNSERFPQDFVFRLSAPEHTALISQIATSKTGRGGRRKLPGAWLRVHTGKVCCRASATSEDISAILWCAGFGCSRCALVG